MRMADARPPARLLTSGAVAGTYVRCLDDLALGSLAACSSAPRPRLTVGFGHAQAKLADLIRGGLLGRASGGVYDEWRTALARDGPWGTALGMSRLARV